MTENAAVTVEPVEFNLTETDLLEAMRLNQVLALKGRRFLIRIAVFPIIAVIGPSLVRWRMDADVFAFGLIISLIYLLAIAIQNTIAYFMTLPRIARKEFLQRREFSGVTKLGVAPCRIALTSENGFSDTPTEDFLKWAENNKSFLLYRSDRIFNLIPRRAIGDDLHQSLVAELNRAGVPKAGFANS